MRDPPNKRMISHFQKMIDVTRNRIVVAKNRSHQLRKKYENGMILKESKKCKKKKEDDYNDELLKVLESDEDDEEEQDGIEIDIECNTELQFDSVSSNTTNKVVDSSESDVSNESS